MNNVSPEREEGLLDTNQVCEFLSIKPGTIRYYVAIGFIPHYKIGGLVRYRKSEIIKWLDKRKRGGRLIIAPNINPEGEETEKS